MQASDKDRLDRRRALATTHVLTALQQRALTAEAEYARERTLRHAQMAQARREAQAQEEQALARLWQQRQELQDQSWKQRQELQEQLWQQQLAAQLKAEAHLAQVIAGFENSFSWRLTRPVRWLSQRLRLLRSLVRAPAPDTARNDALASSRVQESLDVAAEPPAPAGPDVSSAADAPAHLQQAMDSAAVAAAVQDVQTRPANASSVRDDAVALVVCQDASSSGVAMLGLGLIQALSQRRRVVVLLLDGGVLQDAYAQAAEHVLVAHQAGHHYQETAQAIRALCGQYTPEFAVVNGMGCRTVLPALTEAQVPVVGLLHDVAAFGVTWPAFQEVLFWAHKTAFTSAAVQQAVAQVLPHLAADAADLLVPGVVALPEMDPEQRNEGVLLLNSRLVAAVREADDPEPRIVLGFGAVRPDNGVDLFVACAARMLRLVAPHRLLFVWVGQADQDVQSREYAVQVVDQIRRAGLQENVLLVDAQVAPEDAFARADVLLLPTRQNPLPCEAMAAMVYGLPVLCFSQATSVADVLSRHGLAQSCVADYLDTEDMALRLAALLDQKDLTPLGLRCREAAHQEWSMPGYLARLDALIDVAVSQAYQEHQDARTIQESAAFNLDFFSDGRSHSMAAATEAVKYLRAFRTRLGARKPCPGFHPGVFAERSMPPGTAEDPFARYLRQGEPAGFWDYPVIRGGVTTATDGASAQAARFALHIHAYYPDMLPDMCRRLGMNRVRPDLFVSVRNEAAMAQVVQLLAAYEGRVVQIRVVPNAGRDIGPFLTEFGAQLAADYDIIGHLHTKQSLHVTGAPDREVVNEWRDFLLESLLGGDTAGPMADAILAAMLADPALGMVFPDDPVLLGWDANLPEAQALAPALGIEALPQAFNFPVGTMFWMRAEVLQRWVAADFSWEDYPPEPLPTDGTMLHAMERLFGILPESIGMRCGVTYVPGVFR